MPGEGNIAAPTLPLLSSRNGNTGIVANFCARAATEDCEESVLGEEVKSGGSLCGTGGLLDDASLITGF